MRTEIDILQEIHRLIVEELNDFLPEGMERIDEHSVDVDFPDVDRMPRNNMIYIQPNSEAMESLTMCSDQTDFDITMFVLCKRDNQSNLVYKVYNYFGALYKLLRQNQNCNGFVDFIEITGAEFYPAVEGAKNVAGMEITVNIQFVRSFD